MNNRRDILHRMGLEAPDTVREMDEVLKYIEKGHPYAPGTKDARIDLLRSKQVFWHDRTVNTRKGAGRVEIVLPLPAVLVQKKALEEEKKNEQNKKPLKLFVAIIRVGKEVVYATL